MTFIEKSEHNYVRFPVFHALKCKYVPIAGREGKTDNSKEFLAAISGSDENLSHFIKELFAKALGERRCGKRLFWIVDPNGFLYELLKLLFEEVLGTGSVSTVILSKLKESKIYALEGAMVNLSCDAGLSELSTTEFPMSQISSPNITTYRADKKISFPNGSLFINVTQTKPLIAEDLKRFCTVFELPCVCKDSAEHIFEKIRPELPFVVSYLMDTVYANMFGRDPEQIAPDESLIAKLSLVSNVNTIDDCIERYFSKSNCDVIIKEEAHVLYAKYTQAQGYTPIGRNIFYDALRKRGFKEGKMTIIDKRTNEPIGKRTVFIGMSHSSRTYALSPVEMEKMNVKSR